MDIGVAADRLRRRQCAGDGVLQQCLGRFAGQVGGQVEEPGLGRRAHLREPVGRRPDRQHGRIVKCGEGESFAIPDRGDGRSARDRGSGLLDPLAQFDDLDGAGRGMRLDAAPLGPGIGLESSHLAAAPLLMNSYGYLHLRSSSWVNLWVFAEHYHIDN